MDPVILASSFGFVINNHNNQAWLLSSRDVASSAEPRLIHNITLPLQDGGTTLSEELVPVEVWC